MGQELGLDGQPGVFPLYDRCAEMGGIPVNDDGGEQVEPGHAVVLSLAGAVADFALAPDAECVLKGVMSLAIVHCATRGAVRNGSRLSHIQLAPFPLASDPAPYRNRPHEERIDGRFVLERIVPELSQQQARRKDDTGEGGSNPQDVRPVAHRPADGAVRLLDPRQTGTRSVSYE